MRNIPVTPRLYKIIKKQFQTKNNPKTKQIKIKHLNQKQLNKNKIKQIAVKLKNRENFSRNVTSRIASETQLKYETVSHSARPNNKNPRAHTILSFEEFF